MQDILAPDRHASDGDEDNNGWWLVMDQRPADGGGSKPAARFRVVGRSGDEFEVEYAISHHDTTSATREHHGDTGTVIQRILGLLEGIHLFASSQRKRYHEKFSLDD